MKTFQKLVILLTAILTVLFISCDDHDVAKNNNAIPGELNDFMKQVNTNPTLINGERLGDSWRVTRYQYSYPDGSIRKEGDIDYLDSKQVPESDCNDYKEYWVFGANELMQVYEGSCYGKDWNGYYENSVMTVDAGAKILKIDYVKDGGEKTYSEYWNISTLTDIELVLTSTNDTENSFYQYTFRREKF